MNKERYLVGIDPGTKTGLAVWDRQKRKFISINTRTITEALELCRSIQDDAEIWFEDCRQRKWFGTAGRERLKGVGSINRDCSIWQEFCEHHGILFKMIPPKNIATKIKADRFAKLTKWQGRTSEHSRDAAMIVFCG